MTDRQISFRRNPDFFNPLEVLVEKSVTEFKDSPDAIWQDFKADKIDTYSLQPDQIVELQQFLKSDIYKEQDKAGKGIKRLDYLARQFTYLGWNQAKPFFKSKKVRQALTMAIDRQRIIKQYLNGMGVEITSPFFKNSPSYDPSLQPWPFDLQKAQRLLADEGWYDSTGDGILDKMIDGQRVSFQFGLTYYVKNPISKAVAEYVATALKELGIIVTLNGVDVADLSAAFDDKSFDALLLAWALGAPPEDPRQLWYSSGAKEKGSSNAIGFANAEVDKIIDALTYEYDIEKRNALYHQFGRIIYDEQPYTLLYTPKTTLLYRDYVQNVFIPAEHQDLIPGANIAEPESSIFWLKQVP
jgi:peptide/nickel transport system substrate-binding protein